MRVIYKSGRRKVKDEMIAKRASVLGARRVSDVKITHADGTIEVQPAYLHADAMKIVRGSKRSTH